MITTCTKCGKLYEERSPEEANAPDRCCVSCYRSQKEPVQVMRVTRYSRDQGRVKPINLKGGMR